MKKYISALSMLALSTCEPSTKDTKVPDSMPIADAASEVTATFKVRDATTEVLKKPENKELSPEQKKVVELLEALDVKLKAKYSNTGWNYEGKQMMIKTPTGKSLALSIQGELLDISGDPRFRAPDSPEEIFRVFPSSLIMDIKNYERAKKIRVTMSDSGQSSLLKRAKRYDNELDFMFAENGHAYVGRDLKRIFDAFGLTADMSGAKKAEVIIAVLNESL